MAKGKKKGGSKGKDEEKTEEPSMSSLSISEPGPSTSQAEPEEEGLGMGMSSAAARRKAKKAAKAAPIGASIGTTSQPKPSEPPAEPAPVAAAKPEPKEEKVEEDEGLGLGLGGGGKKRPRKKKSLAAQEASSQEAAAVAAVGAVPAAKPVAMAPASGPAQPSVPASAPSPWGSAGRGRGRGVPAAPASYPAPSSVQQQRPGYPQQPGPPMAYQQQPGPPMVYQQQPGPPMAYQQQPGPPTGYQQQPRPPMGYQQQPGPPTGYQQQPGPPMAHPQQVAQQAPQASYAPQQQAASPATSASSASAPASKTLCRYKIPRRIDGNTVPCQPVRVVTNYLEMKFAPLKIHRYDVAFKPDKPKKYIPLAFSHCKKKHFPKELIAFDQMKNCYAKNPLPLGNFVPTADRFGTQVEFQDDNGRIMKFEVSFKATGIVDLGTIVQYMKTGGTSLSPPTEAIQCVDVILRQGTLESYIKAGRQFFKRPYSPIDLGDGLEMWTGLFQSAIFTTRAFINVDVAHKGFPKQQNLLQAFVGDFKLNPNRPIDQQNAEGFTTFVKGLRVVAYIGGDTSRTGQKREFIVNNLSDPANRKKFDIDLPDGTKKTITVAEYFAKEKNVRLQYPNLNCVWVGPREKAIFYPMELLEVAYGHARNRQLNEKQLSTMVRQAATPPDERKRKIEEVIKDMNYPGNKDFKQFGLEISDKFFPVQAKVLPAPRLETGSGIIQPRNGSWQANKLLKAETLQRWGFIVIEPDTRFQPDYAGIITMIKNCGTQMGMVVSEPVVKQFNLTLRDLKNMLFKCLDEQVRFLFIIVPTRGKDYYHKVKKMAERDVGILTQCIKEQTAQRRMNMQTVKNILLKVNSKLMGINQALENRCMPACLREGRVMVVGADVTHPSPDQNVPSIAAVTASIDPKCFMYNIGLSIQTPKKEMIVEFEDMMIEHLQLYRQRNGALPTKIFVFRDGVSEGQFAQVMNSELLAVHQAYQRLAGTGAKPEVLFLLVQKRHHTRLFFENNPRNVEPGTVVDRDIVHATELDFYLVSHQAIKGTARPTRYHAVCNDGGIKHDEVEQLTYYLCHLYSRCMRSVSYPTPTYYAHLACLRARSLTHEEKFDSAGLEKEPKRLRVLDKMLQYSRMFFV